MPRIAPSDRPSSSFLSVDGPHRGRSSRPNRAQRLLLVVALLVAALCIVRPATAESWGEKLGYPADARVLILHADDIGMCYEANEAAKRQLGDGVIQSAAMMVPCPWFNEIAGWYQEHPEQCMGLHLAMTSEWKTYRWGPMSNPRDVPGLVDEDGYLWRSVMGVATHASGEEVEREIRAQVERALSRGIKPSHIDTHMGTLYARPDYTAAYMKVAEEYHIPAMVIEMTPYTIEKFRKQGYPMDERMLELIKNYPLPKLDDFGSIAPAPTYEEKVDTFYQQIRDLQPGITELIFHPSVLTDGLQKITNSWQQRAWEAEMFHDPKVRQFLESEGIVFTNWKEMLRRFDEQAKPPSAE
ncbi:MAG: polysaccharide deacetylase family protein [Planctomycetales bacterium]|nr:polysaccharide deacetylase family protein [Planctomycetales bacterium]